MNKYSIIILGAGGQASVLIDCIFAGALEASIIGITDPDKSIWGTEVLRIPVIGDDDAVFNYLPDDIKLINALGSIVSTHKRKVLFELFKKKGYSFVNIIHPSVVLSPETTINEGVQIMAGVVIQPGCQLADNVLINTMTLIDHDCTIGKNVHIAPGVTVCGGVYIEKGVHVGPGATIIQGAKIGANSFVGAGSLVLKDVRPGAKVYGVPAKEV